jgi:hypothetical protein
MTASSSSPTLTVSSSSTLISIASLTALARIQRRPRDALTNHKDKFFEYIKP